ncbi:hypothetical protein [Paenibacillus glycanilyticus]|uniref:hypothetical protein n=1 Tax=Paenibacillus glycanilyticus TaxID=126569 RepID=UPI00288B0ED0|nr:hypothetical protein [Paenibacillus glycanilyticus]
MDDLFLDLIVLPSGELMEKDAAEIEQAYNSGVIGRELYDLAWKESDKLAEMIKRGEFALLGLSNLHKELLFQMLDVKD